jgi:capsular polysaccharide export protein
VVHAPNDHPLDAGAENPRRLYVFNGGFLFQKRIRRILALSGHRISLGRPGANDLIGVWGNADTAHRGRRMAARTKSPLLTIEDAFLRSLHPGRSGEAPIGLIIDHAGNHFDASTPTDLETLLASHPLDDSALLDRARAAMAQMQDHHLSKYSATRPDLDGPAAGYVLIIDQTKGDASVTASNGDRTRFLEMLTIAREEHPGARFVIKSHPETAAGHRPGHYQDQDCADNISIYSGDASPWTLLNGATAVYTLSSQMGFEAILAGHKPRVFGTPFYAGWGLTEDEIFFPRRGRRLTRAQLFAAAMILYPIWYDPYRDCLCPLETAITTLTAQSRAWREDRQGWVASGMRLWKRGHLQKFFEAPQKLRFAATPAQAKQLAHTDGRRHMAWANTAPANVAHVEDGFLRSKGLGADLIPPLSLVVDHKGIYYDPTRPSDLESHISRRALRLSPSETQRAERLIDQLNQHNLSKYNLSGEIPTLPTGPGRPPVILVPGQVEDDASIRKGTVETGVSTNHHLLAQTRLDNPNAYIVWKPHPDVRAGLRKGHIDDPTQFADLVIGDCDMGALLKQVDEVSTMTSLTGFEALLRGARVVTYGAPFYAGWGLTTDRGEIPERRLTGPRPTLAALVHACLIDYPRYFDPVSGLACPVEIIVERLQKDQIAKPGPFNRTLAKAQGLLSSYAHLWRS